MSKFSDIQKRVSAFYAANEMERERKAILSKPVNNDPALFAPTKVRVVRPFCIGGARVEPGEVVKLPKHDADSMVAIGRAELV